MEKKTLLVEKTARYYTLGDPRNVSGIWFVCHGYGQLAAYFIEKFGCLNDGSQLIVAPEGLHRYYLNGFNGRVGASWMTKEDRDNDIRDYVAYLDKLYREVISGTGNHMVSVTALGFSQGAATASRWAAYGTSRIDNLVLWAGLFPPDMDFSVNREKLNRSGIFLVAGDEDEFLSRINIEGQERILNENSLDYELIRFQGGHSIPEEVLKNVRSRLRNPSI
jgi:predicted esterase